MEFYEFFEKLIEFFPEGYESVKAMCQACLPWLYAFFTLATCFLGHFMHKVWNACLFFSIGFFLPLIILFAVLKEPSGVLSIKYKYMMLMITTSFSGSFLFWNVMEDLLSFTHLLMTAFAVLMGFLGLAVQIFIEKEELKESYHGIREHTEKVKKLHKKIRKEEMY